MALPDGVPALLASQVVSFLLPTGVLAFDTFFGYGLGQPPQWGVFQGGGAPVIIADTVTELDYNQDWAISDYPIERGGFESYDKVNTPFRIHVQFVSGGSLEKREALLSSIAAIGDQLTRYTVLTPEAVYPSVNVERYNYRRTSSKGLGLMVVDVTFIEIREDGGNNFQNTRSPSGAAALPGGNVQSSEITNQLATAGVG